MYINKKDLEIIHECMKIALNTHDHYVYEKYDDIITIACRIQESLMEKIFKRWKEITEKIVMGR